MDKKLIPILLVIGLVVVVSGCTQQSNKLDIEILSAEHYFGVVHDDQVYFVGCGNFEWNYLILTIKSNDDRDIRFSNDYDDSDMEDNNIIFCSEIETTGNYVNCNWEDMPYRYGQCWDTSLASGETVRIPLIINDGILATSTDLCGKTIKIYMTGMHREKTTPKTISEPIEWKWTLPYVIDEHTVSISC